VFVRSSRKAHRGRCPGGAQDGFQRKSSAPGPFSPRGPAACRGHRTPRWRHRLNAARSQNHCCGMFQKGRPRMVTSCHGAKRPLASAHFQHALCLICTSLGRVQNPPSESSCSRLPCRSRAHGAIRQADEVKVVSRRTPMCSEGVPGRALRDGSRPESMVWNH